MANPQYGNGTNPQYGNGSSGVQKQQTQGLPPSLGNPQYGGAFSAQKQQ